ncbi:MAG: ABC transporter transmembrane domain-containing protein [Bacillota bacterium]
MSTEQGASNRVARNDNRKNKVRASSAWKDIRDLLSFLGAYWPLYATCIVLNICANLAYGPGIAYCLAVLTDSITAKDIALVWKAARLLMLMAAVMGALAGLSHYLSSWTLEALALNIRRRVMSRALRAELSYWHTKKTGAAVSLLVNDTETAKQGLSAALRPHRQCRTHPVVRRNPHRLGARHSPGPLCRSRPVSSRGSPFRRAGWEGER